MEIKHIPASPSGSQECSSGTPGAAHLPGPRTHQGTGAKFNLRRPYSWARLIVQGWESPVCQSKPAPSDSHTARSPPSLPAVPPCDNGATLSPGTGPALPRRAELQRATNPLGSRAFPCGEKGQEGSLGVPGVRVQKGKPLCTLCPLFPQSHGPPDIQAENLGINWVGKDLSALSSPTPTDSRAISSWAAQSPIQPGVKYFQSWHIPTSVGSTIPCFTTLTVWNSLLMSNPYQPSFSSNPLLLLLPQQLLLKHFSLSYRPPANTERLQWGREEPRENKPSWDTREGFYNCNFQMEEQAGPPFLPSQPLMDRASSSAKHRAWEPCEAPGDSQSPLMAPKENAKLAKVTPAQPHLALHAQPGHEIWV